MLLVGLLVTRRLLVKFLGSQKLHVDFQLHEGSVPLTPCVQGSTLYGKVYGIVVQEIAA